MKIYKVIALGLFLFSVSTILLGAQDLEQLWPQWSQAVLGSSSNLVASSMVVQEFTMEGRKVGEQEVPLNAQGQPTRQRTGGSGDQPLTLEELPVAFFTIDWDLEDARVIEESTAINTPGAEGRRLRARLPDGQEVLGEIWFLPGNGTLLQTTLYLTLKPQPKVEVEYQGNQVTNAVLETVVDREILADRIRKVFLDYR